jgi:hypothetical protein
MPPASKDALQRSRDLINEAQARRARVALLFGPVSAPDRSTTLAVMELKDALRALEDRPVPDLEKYSAQLAEARERHSQFNEYALREIQGRPWYARWRVVRWIRRLWRRLGERWRQWRKSATEDRD